MPAPNELPQLLHDEREVVFRADFDALDTESCAWVSLHFLKGPRHPRPGEWVYLLDGRGGGCLGCCQEVHGWLARVRPDWNSWIGPDDPPAAAVERPRRRLRSV